jgi:hypothetical protein
MAQMKKRPTKWVFEELDKSGNIEAIKRSIPIIQDLHPSFWDDICFLTWQLIRLNKDYQKFTAKIWSIPALGHTVDYSGIFFMDFLPLPQESYDDWCQRFDNLILGRKCVENLHDDDLYRQLYKLIITLKNYDRLVYLLRKNKHHGISDSFLMKYFIEFRPIPYSVRFPLPRLLFFNLRFSSRFKDRVKIFPDPSFRGRRKERERGRPQNWATNLLVFELSQAGMKNMDIARLLFGIEKSTNHWPDKHPILVRIDDIKKTVQKAVSKAFPLPD